MQALSYRLQPVSSYSSGSRSSTPLTSHLWATLAAPLRGARSNGSLASAEPDNKEVRRLQGNAGSIPKAATQGDTWLIVNDYSLHMQVDELYAALKEFKCSRKLVQRVGPQLLPTSTSQWYIVPEW